MRLLSLETVGFRNLADGKLEFPERGVVLTGANGQGKTNLLEAAGYPVLFRSLRGAADAELVRFERAGFRVAVGFEDGERQREAAASFAQLGRKKRLWIDGGECPRLLDAAGAWLTVGFQPADVALASGPATLRRQYLDRVLALADRHYLIALARYRKALAQRNSALRQQRADVARAFDGPLAAAGARLVSARIEWVSRQREPFCAELVALGEAGEMTLEYSGNGTLAEAGAWPAALAEVADRDRHRGMTTLGPHRDDLVLRLEGRRLRDYGSTGQQRSAAIGLRLLEWNTLAESRGEPPALLLDDAFAELDGERQQRLSARLLGRTGESGQVLLTAPRLDELPPGLDLPVWTVRGGRVEGR
ncbi:MAG TPA: DNA replication and repair protein RecF [Gemmatimonadales bacterium]|nr:DNA replication and repair protein RecF [Gemmatimonadales bacterium]